MHDSLIQNHLKEIKGFSFFKKNSTIEQIEDTLRKQNVFYTKNVFTQNKIAREDSLFFFDKIFQCPEGKIIQIPKFKFQNMVLKDILIIFQKNKIAALYLKSKQSGLDDISQAYNMKYGSPKITPITKEKETFITWEWINTIDTITVMFRERNFFSDEFANVKGFTIEFPNTLLQCAEKNSLHKIINDSLSKKAKNILNDI